MQVDKAEGEGGRSAPNEEAAPSRGLAIDDNDVRFRSLVEQAPFSIQVFSADGRTTRVNRAFEELWGVPFEQLDGYNILQDAQLEAAGTLALIRRGFAGETLRLPAIRYNLNDTLPGVAPVGHADRWLSAVIYPLKDGEGRVREVVIIHEDITARMRAEAEFARLTAAAEQQRRMYETALSNSADFNTVLDRDGRILFVNEPLLDLLKKSLQDVVGKTFFELDYPQGTAEHLHRQIRHVVETGERVKDDIPFPTDSGERQFEYILAPVFGEDGEIEAVAGSTRDITDRKKAEEELRKSERMYRAIGESIEYGVWICDPDGRNRYVSESFLRLVGIRQEEFSELGWKSVLHPEDAEHTMRAWKECVRTGTQWDRQHRYLGVDGKWHSILARGVPVRNEQGEITAWAGINLDISRLKQVEVELREADRRKDEFLATLAHELRNPLAPIRNSLEILKMPRLDPSIAQQTREMMERQVHHLVRLVDDLLDVSRVMRGKIDLRTERVELATVVARAVETAQPLIDLQGHRLEISLPPDSMLLDADPVRLTQVVGNLLTNAAKYTEANGRIWLGAGREDGHAVLRVRDNGIGIAPEKLPHIFELFVQVDHDSSRSQSGLGIGLTLVSKLVGMHGGTVDAFSAGLGKGCELVVRLPLAGGDVAACDNGGEPPSHQQACPSGLRLLVVDDNLDAAESLAILLRLQGHEVHVANDGPSALEVAGKHIPNMVFLDVGMPGMDGCEVARRMRRQPALERTVLAALTGWGQKEDRRRTGDAGFDHHLVKPLEPQLLERLLADLIRAKTA